MYKILIAFAILVILMVQACKIDRKNAEEYNMYVDVVHYKNPKDTIYCFDRVYGQTRPDMVVKCMIKTNKLVLPLNIAADSSVFIFQKGTRFDTLQADYLRSYQLVGSEYQLLMTNYKISKYTFDSVSTICGPAASTFCPTQNDFKITLYF